jgi:hypothetical protein
MNPLIEKYEEIYGEKKEEVVAPDSPDVISLGGDTVIPTAQRMPGGGINLTGSYIDTSALISNGLTMSSCNAINTLTSSQKTYTVPNQTSAEQQFNKVLDDISKGKAVVSSINAEIDQSFTGFGGQIRYTVEIVGTYP